jgi:hypothetical protein
VLKFVQRGRKEGLLNERSDWSFARNMFHVNRITLSKEED